MKKKYYIAYGSNMDIEQMALRCPDAILTGKSELQGYELLFKGSLTGAYATIEANEDSIVPVLIWEISKADETNLDRYEGYPTFYYKKELEAEVEGEKLQAMVYIMDEKRQLGQPSTRYYRILELAYERFGFDLNILKSALKKSTPKGGHSFEFWS
jgi:gamma-glutamylcyclotransferase (GGCT)/AIG2-like uncharacterized protein YtfP